MPLHLVPKSTPGQYRPCGNYRHLNLLPKPDKYPLPNINTLGSKLHDKHMFSKIDLLHAYHQIPMSDEDIEKITIITPFGLSEYLFMPFGLHNNSATFQHFMDNIFVYIDDILVSSETQTQHYEHLKTVLSVLAENNL